MRNALLMILLSGIHLIAAEDTYGQNAFLSLEMENVTIESVLNEIENQSEFFFLYNTKLVNVQKKVDISARKEKISGVLSSLFAGSDTEYLVIGRQIILTPKTDLNGAAGDQSTTAPGNSLEVRKLLRTISGQVKSVDGEPLIGVNILEKGTANGTITDLDGNYSLSISDESAVLIFSYTGYLQQEIAVQNRQVIDVVMEFDAVGLEEIVVVGYGIQKRSDVTGSIASAKMEKFSDIPNYNVFQALQGSMPGLNVTNPDRPGEDPNILIRGFNSLSADNQPLVVVDGIIFNGSLNNFSTNDIASVDVLKDASATAIYGSRAANGVILITTKSGTTEKPTFSFNTYHGFSNPVFLIPLLDGPGYIQKILDFREATGLEADPNKIEDYLTPGEAENYRNGRTIDWMDETIQTASTHSYHLDVSGRSEKTNYYLSGAYFDQEGIVANDNFRRLTLKANFSNDITDWFTLKFNTAYSKLDYSGLPATLTYTYGISPYGTYWEDEERGILRELPHDDPLGVHPLLNTQHNDVDIRNNLLGLISSNIEVPFIRGLSWTMNYATNLRDRKFNQFFSGETLAGRTQNGRASKYHSEAVDWTFDNFLTYKRDFGGKHSINATVLYSREFQRFEFSQLNGNDFFTQQLGYDAIGIAAVQNIQSEYTDQNSVAIMARLNYVFDNKYAITGTVRRDGYSGFGSENKYATFPSMAFSWIISNEGFMSDLPLDLLKLRLSYGENGNQAVGRYQTLARMANAQYVFGTTTVTTLYPSSIANKELGWETTKVFNVGLDFGLLNSRLRGSVDVYSSNTFDLLIQRNIPETTGFQSIWTNLGKIHNQGVELSLNSTNIRRGEDGLNWETGLNFALNRNRIDALTGIDADGDGVEDNDISNSWFIGRPVSVFFGYQVDGIYQLDDEIPSGFSAGEYRLKDTDGQEGLTADDRTILGSSLPNYTFAISNTVQYKNFSLYVLINSIQGGGKDNYYVGNNIRMYNVNQTFSTWTERFNIQDVPYWTPTNPSNTYPIVNYVPSRGHPVLEDRSFVRLQDVRLSYNFNNELVSRLGLLGLRVYVSGKNLYTWTKWSGYDPENATTLGGFPMLRTFTMGADIKF